MTVDIYNDLRLDPGYKKLVASDYMILEYKCPIESAVFQLFSEMHFIMYIVSGRKDWITAQKTYEMKEGDALFLRKGAYTTRQHFDVDHCVLMFFIHDDFIRNFLLENKMPGKSTREFAEYGQIFELEVNESLQALFLSVFHYLKMRDIPRNLVELKFRELLFNVLLNPAHQELAGFFQSLSQVGKTSLEQVMNNHFKYDLGLEEFARLCGRSLSAFKRDFQSHFRQTPGRWLLEKRLEFARNLLLGSDLNVNEVCFESGFRNASHFNKAFKEKYRLPPNQFRQMAQNPEPAG